MRPLPGGRSAVRKAGLDPSLENPVEQWDGPTIQDAEVAVDVPVMLQVGTGGYRQPACSQYPDDPTGEWASAFPVSEGMGDL